MHAAASGAHLALMAGAAAGPARLGVAAYISAARARTAQHSLGKLTVSSGRSYALGPATAMATAGRRAIWTQSASASAARAKGVGYAPAFLVSLRSTYRDLAARAAARLAPVCKCVVFGCEWVCVCARQRCASVGHLTVVCPTASINFHSRFSTPSRASMHIIAKRLLLS